MPRLLALATLLAAMLHACPASAQPAERRTLAATRRRGPIAIDGALDEADWARARVGADFVERLPRPGATPPVRTEVRVLVDPQALYVAVTSFLAEGETPRALELTRDSSRVWSDDAVTVKLDVRQDRRSTVGFAVNPAGARVDFVALDNGRSFRREVDMVWDVATRVHEDRWIAEFRIPVAALRLPPGREGQIFGFNVTRDHNARLATYDWSHLPPEFGAMSALHYGDLSDVEELGGGRPFIVTPYVLASAAGQDDLTAMTGDLAVDLGLKAGGELRLRLADDVWGELTALTDFAEVDLDSQVVNLDRFPLFFPERRPFFLTGLDVFEFGALGEAQLFFSRRIGLDAAARPVPIYGGIKAYGREGFLSFGVLDVATEATVDQPGANYGVARVRANLGDASYIGALFGSRAFISDRDGFFGDLDPEPHWTAGLDGLVRALDGRLEINGFGAFTAREGTDAAEGLAGRAEVRWRGEQWMPSASVLYIQDGFAPELGFVRRPAILQGNAEIPWVTRNPAPGIRDIRLAASGRVEASDLADELLRLSGGWNAGLTLQDGHELLADASYIHDVVREPFDLVGDVTIAPGEYRGAIMRAQFNSSSVRNPVVGVSVSAQNGFFGGFAYRGEASLAASIGPHFRTSIEAAGALLDLPGRDLIPTLAVNSVFSITPSPWVVLDLVGQLNTVSERVIGMARLRWRYLPGSDLFLVYREQLDYGDEVTERRVTLKLSYRYDVLL